MQPITAIVLDRILAFLAPLFLAGAGGDLPAARAAAAEVLLGYGARTEPEIRMVALVIAFSHRALDALARATEPGLDLRTVLRLNSNAAALSRVALRCQKELDRLRAQAPADQTAAADLTELLPADLEPAPHRPTHPPRNADVDAPISAFIGPSETDTLAPSSLPPAPVTPALSRQQRRAAERLAAKVLRRGQDRVRQADPAGLRLMPAREAA